MTNEPLLVFRDAAGNYYRLARSVLERARVPQEEVAATEEALGGEVEGHSQRDELIYNPAAPRYNDDMTQMSRFTFVGFYQPTDR